MSVDQSQLNVTSAYARRFQGMEAFRQEMWKALCVDFFQAYVRPDDTVLELAAGYCEFINNIQARRKIAVDLNPDMPTYAAHDVETHVAASEPLDMLQTETVDVVWASNFLEHIDKPTIIRTLQAAQRVLRPNGRFLILQPNIRFVGNDYWMFFDHITPLCDRSLCEALETEGYRIERCIPRFLPYTSRGRLPKSITAVRAYIRLPFLWHIFGGQAFVVAAKQ